MSSSSNTCKRRTIRSKNGKMYSYAFISGIPICDYIRQEAQKRYLPHPNPSVKATELAADAIQRVHELHAEGHSQNWIAQELNTTRYRVQRILGKR